MLTSALKTEGNKTRSVPDLGGGSRSSAVLRIEKVVAGGYGLGRVGGQIVLVPGALSGELAAVQLGAKRRGVSHAKILEILQPSPERLVPQCLIAGQCGGCQFQNQTYAGQLVQKQAILRDALWRLGKVTIPDLPSVVPSPQPFHYRTSIRFVVFKQDQRFRLGFYRSGTRTPIHAPRCLLIPGGAEALVTEVVQSLSAQRSLPLLVESLELRWSQQSQKGLLIFRGRYRYEHQARALLDAFGHIPDVVGLVVELGHDDCPSVATPPVVVVGRDHLRERFHELTLRIGFRSFVQANWAVYEILGQRLAEWGKDLKDRRILELYAGVGALGLRFALQGARVTLVEGNPWAMSDARRSAALSHVSGCRFLTKKTEAFLSSTMVGDYDAIIVDPPRIGLSLVATQELGRIHPPRIFYVSCDPATLARDVSRLSFYGYRIQRIQAFDMFPQTTHIETLVELTF